MAEDSKKNSIADNDGWTPVWEGKPKKAGAYLVTRIKPRGTTMAFYEDGKWWNDPLHTDFWPSYMIVAWKPRPAPFAGNPVTFVPDVDLKAAVEVLKQREKDIERYAYIMEQVWKVNVSEDESFQRVFNAFYRVRRDDEWRKVFYELFEKVKQNSQSRFDRTLENLLARTGNIEPSFVSKMIATIAPDEPIWDSHVLEVLGLKPRKKSGKYQFDDVYDCYCNIGNWYDDFKRLPVAKKWVRAFDRALPEHKDIGVTKKIDFILWAAGSNQSKKIKFGSACHSVSS